MLSSSNAKLGKIRNWSIPAILTCPGKSKLCSSLCYADDGFFLMPSVKKSHNDNLKLTKDTKWVADMIAEINKKKDTIIRIHCAGDFYNKSYIAKWLKIVQACPGKVFYAYTRSWRKAALLPALIELAEQINMQLWFSVDKETGEAPRHDQIKQAYLSTDDEDVPAFDVDLVFRDKTKTTVKRVGGALVCPYEQNITNAKVTCQSCKICYKDALVRLSV